jgi:hypothetical protein
VKRLAYGLVFLSAAGGAVYWFGLGVWQFWFFALAPDLVFFFARGPNQQKGQINPRAVPLYNAAHSLIGPTLLAAAVLLLVGSGPWLAGALAWAAHIAADRALGFGPRARTGFMRDAT